MGFTRKSAGPGLFWVALAALLFYLRWPYLAPDMLLMDEGILFQVGKTLAAGGTLYADAFEYKPPLNFFIYAASINAFGPDATPVQILVAFVHLMVAWSVFRLGSASWNPTAGRLGAVIYVISVHALPWFNCMTANTESLCLLFVAPAVLLILPVVEGSGAPGFRRLFTAGALIGFAAMVSLPAGLVGFILFAVVVLSLKDQQDVMGRILFAGCCLLGGFIAALCLTLFLMPVDLDGFKLSLDAGRLSLHQWRHVEGTGRWELFGFVHGALLVRHTLIWIAGLAGLAALCARRTLPGLLLVLFAAWGFLFTNLTGRYFGHYFLLLYPFLAACAGGAVNMLMEWMESDGRRKAVVIPLVLAGLLFPLVNTFVYHMTSEDEAYFTKERFPSDLNVGRALTPGLWLKQRTPPDETILVLNGHVQIYNYADRLPATRFVAPDPSYLYFGENPEDRTVVGRIRDLLLEDVRRSRPRYVLALASGRLFEERSSTHDAQIDPLAEWLEGNYVLEDRRFEGYLVYRRLDTFEY